MMSFGNAMARRQAARALTVWVALFSAACDTGPLPADIKANHLIVTLEDDLTQGFLAGLNASGVKLLGRRAARQYLAYLPDSMAPNMNGVQPALGSALGLNWTIPTYGQKVAAALQNKQGDFNVTVQVYRDVSRADMQAALVDLCKEPSCASIPFGPTTWRISLTDDHLGPLAELDIVKRIEDAPAYLIFLNSEARSKVFTNKAHQVAGITGKGAKVGVADSGIFRSHDDFKPPDVKFYASRTGKVDEHATLVASIIGSRGGSTDPALYGHAPDSSIGNYAPFSVDFEDTRLALVDDGSQVVNHSYTISNRLGYPIDVSEADLLIRGGVTAKGLDPIPAVPQVWAGDGVGAGYPASNEGKNMIVVSSVDTATCGMDSKSCVHPFEPVASQTTDGRIKPDLVAPGCRKWLAPNEEGIHGASDAAVDQYQQGCGGSYAAPVVSGAIALMIEALKKLNLNISGFKNPATYRAVLVQTAIDQLGQPGDPRNHTPGPDRPSGWGLVNVEEAVALVSKSGRWGEQLLMETMTEVDRYCMTLPANEGFRVTLAWDDLPGEACDDPVEVAESVVSDRRIASTDVKVSGPICNAQTSKLVQDLDLVVRQLDTGITAHPWSFGAAAGGGLSLLQSAPDRRNNIEVVDFAPEDGAVPDEVQWTIEVSAHHLIEPQQYSLAASVAFATCPEELEPPDLSVAPPVTGPDVEPEPDPLASLALPVGLTQICEATSGCQPCSGEESGTCAGFEIEISGLPERGRLVLFDMSGAEQRLAIREGTSGQVIRVPSRPVGEEFYLQLVPTEGQSLLPQDFLLRYEKPRLPMRYRVNDRWPPRPASR